jgi:hypothetical protein
MQLAAEKIYTHFIELFHEMVKFYEESPLKHAWKSFSAPLSVRFAPIIDAIDEQSQTMRHFASALAKREQRLMLKLLELIGKDVSVMAVDVSRLADAVVCEFALSAVIDIWLLLMADDDSYAINHQQHSDQSQRSAGRQDDIRDKVGRLWRAVGDSRFSIAILSETPSATAEGYRCALAFSRSETLELQCYLRRHLDPRLYHQQGHREDAARHCHGGLRPAIVRSYSLGFTGAWSIEIRADDNSPASEASGHASPAFAELKRGRSDLSRVQRNPHRQCLHHRALDRHPQARLIRHAPGIHRRRSEPAESRR